MAAMNFDLLVLRAFVCLAGELNFSRAAARLHVSAPRLTRMIQSLEAEVGTRLLARNTHSVALTEPGAEFLRSARRIVAEADWVGRRLNRRTEEGGTFTVGCVSGALYDALPARVRAARLELPNLQFRLVEMTETALAQQVLDGTVDMGFTYFPMPDDELASRVVSRNAQWVAMEQQHRLAGRATLTLGDLAGEVLILPDESRSPRLHRWYRDFLDPKGRRDFAYVNANQISVALGLCAAGEGLCVFPEHLRRLRADDLHFAPLARAPRTELTAIWRHDSPLRQVAQFLARW
jgi:DNA-binding transcriptional LysR family regulator